MICRSAGRLGPKRKGFEDLTLAEYAKLDAILNHQSEVLYMSQIQRLDYMVDVDRGDLTKAVDGSPYHMNGSSVVEDLGMRGSKKMCSYEVYWYGNLFVVR